VKKLGFNFVAAIIVSLVVAGTSLAAAPINSAVPTVSGYVHAGYVLSAAKGTWAGSPVAFTYQWQECSNRADVGTCADIGGATRVTYTPVVGNSGKGIRVKVTAVNNARESASAYSAVTANVSNAAPVNWMAPVTSGYQHVGYALSATTGTFDAPKPTYTYQWQSCTNRANAGTCSDIVGATRPTYTAVTGDAGKFLRVGVIARNTQAQFSAAAYSLIDQTPIGNTAPVNWVAPVTSGYEHVGYALSATTGTFDAPKPTYTYQWQSCTDKTDAGTCADIARATRATYTPVIADVGKFLRVGVRARNTQAQVSSAAYSLIEQTAIGNSPPVNRGVPAISGNLYVGQSLSSTSGTFDAPSPTVTYQWQRCTDKTDAGTCTNIARANRPKYIVVSDDNGRFLRVGVVARNTQGQSSAVAYSAIEQTGVANNQAAPVYRSGMTIDNATPDPGDVLTAAPGSWDGVPAPTFAYQWLRCPWTDAGPTVSPGCAPIKNATSSTYALVPADTGMKLRVKVAASNFVRSGVIHASLPTDVVGAMAPENTVASSITGSAVSGQTLTAHNGTWTGIPAPAFTYQWQRCSDDSDPGACVDITGASHATYRLVGGDGGSYVRVVVTATNGSGSAASTSDATALVVAAPKNTVRASISGSAVVGRTLTADPGTWTGYPAWTLTYQWRSCIVSTLAGDCSDIDGATASTYRLTGDDAGSYIRVVVTGTNAFGSDASTSAATAAVGAGPKNRHPAWIDTTTPAVGDVITADPGSWDGLPAPTFTYQWQRCSDSGDLGTCSDIDGATDSTYTPVDPDDVASFIRVVVNGTNGFGSGTSTSAATAAVEGPPAAPASTVAASIDNTSPGVGDVLTADPGSWDGVPAPTFTYQWQRCSDRGDLGSCSDIDGATDRTYTVVDPDDVGSYVRVVVTATNDSGSDTSTSDLTDAVDAAPVVPVAPANTVAAWIDNTMPGVGDVLTADPGWWDGVPAPTFTYQWQRCSDSGDLGTCADIDGATDSTYLVVDPDDVGSYLRVVVTGTNDSGSDASTSDLTDGVDAAPAAPEAPANTVGASISGSAVAGQMLTADPGTWTGSPAATLTYQWQRCSDDSDPGNCSDIDGATDSTYLLVDPDDVGSFVRVVVTATNDSGSDASTSDATAAVDAAPAAPEAPANTVGASISGSAVAGQTLTADPGTWTGTPAPTLTYQWRRCSDDSDTESCVDIGGATDSTYVVVDPDDVGSYVRVVVTARNDLGSDTSTSDATAAVDAAPPAPVAPANSVAASISGSAVAGQMLTAHPGTWTGAPAPTLTYQWRRCSDDSDPANCADIDGATDSTYLVVDPDDVASYLRVVVTATNASGSDVSTSDATAAVDAAPAPPAAPANSVAASVTGAAVAGQTLTAEPGTWTGTPAPTLTYQWRRCSDDSDPANCADIGGATASTYLVVDPDDVGSYVRVVVTATNDSGSDTSTSAATAAVTAAPAAPANTVAASVTGAAVAGQTLTAEPGTWSGTPAPTLTYPVAAVQ